MIPPQLQKLIKEHTFNLNSIRSNRHSNSFWRRRHSSPYDVRTKWSQFWLIDPLNRAKKFVNRNGEFTIHIALIENGKSTLGTVYIPVSKEIYFADKLAYKIENVKTPINSFTTLLGQTIRLPLSQQQILQMNKEQQIEN